MNKEAYQCPLCRRSYMNDDPKIRLCGQFSLMLSEEERRKTRVVYKRFVLYLTRECELVSQGWKNNCAGFRPKQPEIPSRYKQPLAPPTSSSHKKL